MKNLINVFILSAIIFSCTFNTTKKQKSFEIYNDSIFIENDTYSIKANFPIIDNNLETNIIRDNVEQTIEEFKDNSPKDPSSDSYKNELLISTEIHTVKSNIISIILKYYQYTGGAHGNTFYSSMIINGETNESYQLSDFFEGNIMNMIQKPVRNKLNSTLSTPDFIDVGTETLADFNVFTLTDSSITFWFAPYQVATYSEGTQKVTLNFEDLPNFKWPK